jgi:thiol:disulfide interchange protein
MSQRTTILIVVLLLVALVAVQRFQQPARPGIFADMTFERAQDAAAAAAQTGGTPEKLLVVDFGASWCPPCRQMDRSTWTDPTLAGWLEEHAISIKIDADEDPGRMRALGVTAVPTVVVLRGSQELGRVTGLRSAGELLEWLRGLYAKS